MALKKNPRKRKITLLKKIRSNLFPHKIFLFFVVFGVSLVTLIGTFSWFTSSDKNVNAFEGTYLVAQIEETFMPKKDWNPGEQVTKEVRIVNTGDTPAIIRVSLYEFLLNFQLDMTDQTGNGNLKKVQQAVSPYVDDKNTDTWAKAAQAQGTYNQGTSYYVANNAWVSDPDKKTGMYEYNGKRNDSEPYKYIKLNFTDQIKINVDSDKKEDYWLYENGYFYYSRPLQPGESSIDLLKSVTLSQSIPNSYKGALYKLKVYMDAHDTTAPVLDTWSLTKESPAYTLVESQLQ